MAEEAQNNNAQAPQAAPENAQPEVAFQLQRCYLKDASIEMPGAPKLFLEAPKSQPQVDLQFEVSVHHFAPLHEICVRATVTIKAGEDVLTIVEGKQAGIFVIDGLDEAQMRTVCNVACPSIIYPYLRANIADMLSRTSMSPVHLPEMDFAGLYAQRQAQAAEEAAKAAAPAQA